MKKFLVGSVLLNLVFAAVLGTYLKKSDVRAKSNQHTAKILANTTGEKIHQTIPENVSPAELVPIDWRAVESADFKEYIKNLRAIGCPEETVRDIIIADVSKLFAARRIAMFASSKDLNYWEANPQNEMWRQRKFQKQNQILERENRDLIQELLGIDLNKEMQKFYGNGDLDRTEKMLSFLPPEKSASVRSLREKYQNLIEKVQEEADDINSIETQEQIKNIRAEQKKELALLLSPEEMRQYNLRLSDTARSLRSGLMGFEASEDEFASLHAIRERFDSLIENIPRDSNDLEGLRKRSDLAKQAEDEIKNSMTPERYEEYKRSQDHEYRELWNFTQEFDLPKGAADQAYKIKKTAEDAMRQVRSNRDLTADQRKETLERLGAEAESTLTQILGEKGLKSYKRRSGWWIDVLRR